MKGDKFIIFEIKTIMAEHIEVGNAGEDLAAKYLIEKGYQVLERNWRYGNDEIDIIAQKDEILAIVEVKTRRSDYYGAPYTAVNKAKQKFMIRAAEAYLNKYDLDVEVSFDIVSIVLRKDKPHIEHIDEAFQPTW